MIKRVVETKWFHHSMVAVIVLAGIVAGLETSPAIVQRHGPMLHAFDFLILGVFVAEALLKMVAHGRRPWLYFADGGNVFDFLIIVLCVLPVGRAVCGGAATGAGVASAPAGQRVAQAATAGWSAA